MRGSQLKKSTESHKEGLIAPRKFRALARDHQQNLPRRSPISYREGNSESDNISR